MTRQASAPTLADVLRAVETFGAAYHDLQVSVEALRQELRDHDAASTRDRAGLREEQIAMRRHVDLRFDAYGLELNRYADQIVELQQVRTEVQMRLNDTDERLADLDAWRQQVEQRLATLEAERATG